MTPALARSPAADGDMALSADCELRMRRLADRMTHGAMFRMLLSSGRRVVFPYVSAGIAGIAGVSADAIVTDARALDGLMTEPDRLRFHRAVAESAEMLTAVDVVLEHRLPSGDGRWFHYCATPSLLGDASVVWDGIVLDVTSEHVLERALGGDGPAASAPCGCATSLARLSHQLRNALAPIPYGLALLDHQPTDADLKRHVSNAIMEQVEHIAHLLDDLDGQQAGATVPTRTDAAIALGDLIHGSQRPSPQVLQSREVAVVALHTERTTLTDSDRKWLVQILINA